MRNWHYSISWSFSAAALACAFLACNKFEREDLTSTTAAPQASPNCSSCHAYPLQDLHHAYHFFNADTMRIVKGVNGRISCVDCHSTAMASQVYELKDSICADELLPSGWSALDNPEDFANCMLTQPLLKVDTIRQTRPIPLPARPGPLPRLTEWMTGLAHMNGKVDVMFAPRVVDHANHPDGGEVWKPQALTCSAIACHEKHGEYRWGSPSRGLPGLHGTHE